MKAEELNEIHGNPANWHLVFFYFAPQDPRMVVKKRMGGMGWTLNFARPLAVPFLVAVGGCFYGILHFLSHYPLSETSQWAVLLLLISAVLGLCSWMANPRRFEK